MQELRAASFDEFVAWYLARERRKNPQRTVPETAPERRDMMYNDHRGKLRGWFEEGRWGVVLFEKPDELESLIFHEADWVRKEGFLVGTGEDYRLLGRVVSNAIQAGFPWNSSDLRHLTYCTAIGRGHFRLEGSSRLVVCTPNPEEKQRNPSGTYYLHDGTARALAYMVLVKQEAIPFEPVEAFLAAK